MKEVHFSNIRASNDLVHHNEIKAHIARKAGYELKDNGTYEAISRFDRYCNWVMGNAAVDRYKRNTFDSNHHAAATLISARHRAERGWNASPIRSDAMLKSRVYRQDFVRHNPAFRNSLRRKPHANKAFMTLGEHQKNRCALFLSRMAHFTDGLNELAAAPTGLSVKLSKLIWTPNLRDHSPGSYMRLIPSLVAISLGVTVVLYGMLTMGLSRGLSGFLPAQAAGTLSKLDAVSGFLGASTYLLGAASSALMKKEDLTAPILDHIDNNRQRYVNRLVHLLRSVEKQSGGELLLRKALKIEGHSPNPAESNLAMTKKERRSMLLDQLLHTVRGCEDNRGAAIKIERLLGEHFTTFSGGGAEAGRVLDPSNWLDRRVITARERDFVRITNLLEHARTETHIGDDGFNNNRTNIEKSLSKVRGPIYRGVSAGLKSVGLHAAANHVRSVLSEEHKARVQREDSLPPHLANRVFTVDRILKNPHQYAWWVRGAASAVKLAHVLSFGVAMSTNYLMTRPFAAAHRVIEGKITGGIHSRSMSFSFGRASAGAIWACLFTLTGAGVAVAGANILKIGGGISIGASNTAAQMILLSGVAGALVMLLESGLLSMGGYKGDSSAPLKHTLPNGEKGSLSWN